MGIRVKAQRRVAQDSYGSRWSSDLQTIHVAPVRMYFFLRFFRSTIGSNHLLDLRSIFYLNSPGNRDVRYLLIYHADTIRFQIDLI